VNQWHLISRSEHRRGLDNMQVHGLWGLHIEFSGWYPTRTIEDPDQVADLWNWLVTEACERRQLGIFVSQFNGNAHLSKHGNTKPIKAGSVRRQLERGAAIIRERGNAGGLVWYQPVGETQTDPDRAFERWAHAYMAGWKRVYNGGSRPSRAPAGWEGFAFHPNSTRQEPPAGAICVTDTSGILTELTPAGRDFHHSLFDPARVAAYVRQCARWGLPCHLYGYGHDEYDHGAIRAAGEAYRAVAGQPEAPAPVPVPPGDAAYRWDKWPTVKFSINRTGWPTKTDKGKVLDGLLYVNARKVEWVAQGRDWSTVRNAITRGRYYRPELKPGDIVDVEVVDISGKSRGAGVGRLRWGP